ncbi:MAG TPA: nucleotidyltransferase family protein [Gaiellales bacterium]|nr:nucleotidyltransferase family protein [Gaiellales bacterium]
MGRLIVGIVLAAGEGSRFGAAKQLHLLDGRPLLEHVTAALADTRLDRRLVVLGAHAAEVLATVNLHGAQPVVCERWSEGQAASLTAGIDEAPDAAAAVVVLGDGPSLEPAAVNRLLEAHARRPDDLLAADYGAGRAHPVVIPRTLWPLLPDRGETPARRLPAILVPCTDLAAPGDVDRPDDLAAVRLRPSHLG